MDADPPHDPPRGCLTLPTEWIVFAPFERDTPEPPRDLLLCVPDQLTLDHTTRAAERVTSHDGQVDLRELLGAPLSDEAFGKVALVFVSLHSDEPQTVTLGLGGDYLLRAWLNGEPVLGCDGPVEDPHWPPGIDDLQVDVALDQGPSVLAVQLVAGKGSSVLAIGGPDELRQPARRSILADPLRTDPRWSLPELHAPIGSKPPIDIGTRRELFVDDVLIDTLTGSASRRLHHPVPRGTAFVPDQPWEGMTAGYYTLIAVDGGYRLYYSGRPDRSANAGDRNTDQFACVAESDDAITFTRPSLGLVEFDGSRDNNILLGGPPGHNFTPFLDTNPNAHADQRFKAIAYHPGGGSALGVFGSPDGYHWKRLRDEPAITHGHFDSQNLAFWDPNLGQYACYCRINTGGLRRVQRATSPDFLQWTKPVEVTYDDPRLTHVYTNGIAPYCRAPHLYLGVAARYVPERQKVARHALGSISDAFLMSSRDGAHFQRWEEGLIRPGPEPEVWTDRNHYPAWGMAHTGPHEQSLYWTEHNRQPTRRLRRGTIRTDGFVSLHADGANVGEMLTRPLTIAGQHLTVNYATSAVGSIRFELCDAQGRALPGLSLGDSDVLYGNEIEATVTWRGRPDIRISPGATVRLRVRLHDADLYALAFCDGSSSVGQA